MTLHESKPAKALENILVLDLSRILAGPYCTMVLGDLGARVIKIEQPGTGDPSRLWGPPFAGGESAYFLSVNRNKESVTLDFKHPRGAEILLELVRKADVLVENYRVGTLERLGFGYAACAAVNPRLVYASITGYGQTGPEADRPGYDLIAQGEGGVMSLTGDADGPPYKTGASQADITAGLWALTGILAALHARRETGRGQKVDVSLLDGQIGLLGYQAVNYFLTGRVPGRMGGRHPALTPYETFATADGYLNVAVGSEAQWRAFCRVIGREDLTRDPRFATNALRVENRDALEPILVAEMRRRPAPEWLNELKALRVPSGLVRSAAEALESDQVRHRGMVVSVEHPTAGPIRLTGLPFKLSETPGGPEIPPPLLGEHTEPILVELAGLSREDLADLRRGGVL